MHYNKRINSKAKSRGKVQLPSINKTITAISQYNPSSLVTKANSSFFQQGLSYQQRLQWLLKPSLYQKMSFKQVQDQYRQLRKQLFALNDHVGHFLNRADKKYSKKRMITMEPQKIQQVREKQIENNQLIIDRMLDQYTKLRNKCQTLQPKQSLQEKIQNAKSQIKSTKEKLNQMKLKNKKLGNKIMDTDQLFVDIHQCERELDTWNKRKATMQSKLAQIQKEQSKIVQNFKVIDQKSSNAEQFWHNENSKQSNIQAQLKNEASYNQKVTILEALKRSLNSNGQLKQQKYHQILKQLEDTHKKISHLQQKTPESEIKNIEAKLERQKLEIKYRQLQKVRIQKQKNSSNYIQAESIDFAKEERAQKIRFNTVIHKSNPSKKNSTLDAFQNKKPTIQTKKTFSNQTEIKQSKSFIPKPLITVQKNSMKISKFTVSQGIGTSQMDNKSETVQVDQILAKQQIDKIQNKLESTPKNKKFTLNQQKMQSLNSKPQKNLEQKQINQIQQIDQKLNSSSKKKLEVQKIQQNQANQSSRYQAKSQQNQKNNQQMYQFNKQVLKSKQLISATQKKAKQRQNPSQQQNVTYKFDIDLTNVKKNMQSISKKEKQKKFSSRMAVVNVAPAQDLQSSQEA